MTISRPISVIGLGNILMRDEGLGVHVIRAFQERYVAPDNVEIIDGGTAGFDLLPLIEGREKVLLVDAVNFGREPGFIDVLANDEIPARFGTKASLHHLGLMDILSIMKLAGSVPKEVCLIGIQPKMLEVGLDMTPEMCDKVGALVERVVNKLRDWNVQCVLQSPQKSST